jgi:hypothetical protein
MTTTKTVATSPETSHERYNAERTERTFAEDDELSRGIVSL